MKLALLSDIHANLQALEACMGHAADKGIDQWAFLGDLVGYGADPVAVLDCIRSYCERGALVVQGNHDAMAVSPPSQSDLYGEVTAKWTHQQLSPTHLQFLAELPLTVLIEDVLLVHASADAPHKWRYVEDARSAQASLDAATTNATIRYVLGGHVHKQTLYYRGNGRGLMMFTPTPGVPVPMPAHRQWIATVGSVGQPRDGKPLAMYALFDSAQRHLTFYRIPYDCTGAAAAVRRAGLPEYFARRLEEGR